MEKDTQGIIKMQVVISNAEDAAEKAQSLIDKINEAKALAGELASLCEKVEVDSFKS